MINWFDMPAEGLSNGGQFEVKELEVTENGTYEEKGEMYNKVTVNVEGGGGESDFSTAKLTYEVIGQVATPPIYISRIWDNAITSIIPVVGTYDVVLYKGVAYGMLDTDDNVSVDGAIEYDDGDLVITGDCTITIS